VREREREGDWYRARRRRRRAPATTAPKTSPRSSGRRPGRRSATRPTDTHIVRAAAATTGSSAAPRHQSSTGATSARRTDTTSATAGGGGRTWTTWSVGWRSDADAATWWRPSGCGRRSDSSACVAARATAGGADRATWRTAAGATPPAIRSSSASPTVMRGSWSNGQSGVARGE